MSTKVIAIAVVAVVVVAGAGVGVYFLLNNNKGGSSDVVMPDLQICGNANLDKTIDNYDLQIIMDIINGDKSFKDYPLADANGDGEVNNDDRLLVDNIIERKEGTTIYVYCLNTSGDMVSVPVSYPLNNVIPFGTNVVEPSLYAGGGPHTVAYFGKSNYPICESSMVDKIGVTVLGDPAKSAGRAISDDAWKDLMDLDASLKAADKKIGAFLLDYSGREALTETFQNDLKSAGIPVLSFASADAISEIRAVLTLSFLYGTTEEALGLNYANTSWKVLEKINSTLSGLKDDDKKTYIAFTMGIYVCQNDSTFNTTGAEAKGLPYYKTNSTFKAAYEGTSSAKMESTEALSNYDDADFMFSNRSIDYGKLTPAAVKKEVKGTWDKKTGDNKYSDFFKNLDNYHNLVYVNNLLPGAVKIAYMAYSMYGADYVELNFAWAESVLQEFIDGGYAPFSGQTVTSTMPIITYAMYEAASA